MSSWFMMFYLWQQFNQRATGWMLDPTQALKSSSDPRKGRNVWIKNNFNKFYHRMPCMWCAPYPCLLVIARFLRQLPHSITTPTVHSLKYLTWLCESSSTNAKGHPSGVAQLIFKKSILLVSQKETACSRPRVSRNEFVFGSSVQARFSNCEINWLSIKHTSTTLDPTPTYI